METVLSVHPHERTLFEKEIARLEKENESLRNSLQYASDEIFRLRYEHESESEPSWTVCNCTNQCRTCGTCCKHPCQHRFGGPYVVKTTDNTEQSKLPGL